MANLKDLNVEQLKAMGLTEEQIQGILGVKNDTSNSGSLPFPLVKVNYDSDLGKIGSICFNPKKDDDGVVVECEKVFDNPFKVRFLKSAYQYSKYDATLNKTTIVSNIFSNLQDAKKAYDLKSGVAISELKENDDTVKFNRISLVELYDDEGNSYTGIWYIKGAYLFELNDILNKFDNNAHLSQILEIQNKKRKKGTVTYFTPELVGNEEVDFLKTIKDDSEKIVKFDKWIEDVNSGGTQQQSTSQSSSSTDDIDEEDYELD